MCHQLPPGDFARASALIWERNIHENTDNIISRGLLGLRSPGREISGDIGDGFIQKISGTLRANYGGAPIR